MLSKVHLDTLKEVANLPTAPFAEGRVIAYVRRFVDHRPQLRLQADDFGNLLVKYTPKSKAAPKGRPILFAAHMDHPGFVAGKMLDSAHLHAEWYGGVRGRYFKKNGRIKFFAEGRWHPATIAKVIRPAPTKPRGKAGAAPGRSDAPPKAVVAKVAGPVPPGSPGMWDLSDAVIRGNRLHARATDDLSGVAAVICTLREICRKGCKSPCYALFTRAEEVGFAGALAALDGGTLPRSALVVAVENSSVIPGVLMGGGPILRVGDRMTVFTPEVTSYCGAVAERLAKKDKSFHFQRKLMDGGACESTAYCHHGLNANCICLPLINYHNMDVARRRIAPESIDVRDYLNLVKWFIALAESPAKRTLDDSRSAVGKKLAGLLRKHRRRLVQTACC